MAAKKRRRTRRTYTSEFKAEAVKLGAGGRAVAGPGSAGLGRDRECAGALGPEGQRGRRPERRSPQPSEPS